MTTPPPPPHPPTEDIPGLVRQIRSLRGAAVFVGFAVCLHVLVELVRPWLPTPPVAAPAGNRPDTGTLPAGNRPDTSLPPASAAGPVAASGFGNSVTIQAAPVPGLAPSVAAALPDAPRTVEQVAAFLGVTPDTVREVYIPDWIAAGLMSPDDKLRNRWSIPPSFTPYRSR